MKRRGKSDKQCARDSRSQIMAARPHPEKCATMASLPTNDRTIAREAGRKITKWREGGLKLPQHLLIPEGIRGGAVPRPPGSFLTLGCPKKLNPSPLGWSIFESLAPIHACGRRQNKQGGLHPKRVNRFFTYCVKEFKAQNA